MTVGELKKLLDKVPDTYCVQMGNHDLADYYQVELKYSTEGKNFANIIHFNPDNSW